MTAGDKTLALLFNHPTHPLQSSQTHIDTGHPGYAVEFVEAAFPGSIGLYADACGGNQFPDRGVIMFASANQVKTLGKQLGESAVAIAQGETLDVTGKISSTLEILSLPLAEPMSYEKAKRLAQEKKVPLAIGLVPYPHPDRSTNWVRASSSTTSKESRSRRGRPTASAPMTNSWSKSWTITANSPASSRK